MKIKVLKKINKIVRGFILLVSFVLFSHPLIFTQEIAFRYNFDDCSYEDAIIGFPGITPGGSPECLCGLSKKSFYLDGSNDFLTLSNQVNPLLDEDFTLDLYFWIEDQNTESDIMSHRFGCTSLDSLMALRYLPSTNELLFEIASNVNNYHSVRKVLSKDNCWHRFTLVKFKLEYLVYIDNQLVKRILSRENINFSKRAELTFANSPCNIVNQAMKFKGRIDEIVLYKRALSEIEILNLFRFPDQIITASTTIFKGESILLEVGTSCASDIIWSPGASLDNPTLSSPTATPTVSTTFTATFNNGNCTSRDTIRIFVADKEKLDCNNLLLPKAFTPNNDGLNDRYGISNTFLIETMQYFEIYDRWGAKVWETREPTELWDGTLNGQPLNTGMYLYKIKYTCNQEEKLNINNFSLLR